MRFETMVMWGLIVGAVCLLLVPGGIVAGYLGLGVKTVSADNFEKNYGWFKDQETAMQQVLNQLCYSDKEIAQFKKDYGAPINYSRETRQEYEDLNFVKRGYVSKYNSLAAEYNSHRANFIKSFGRDPQLPQDRQPYYETMCN